MCLFKFVKMRKLKFNFSVALVTFQVFTSVWLVVQVCHRISVFGKLDYPALDKPVESGWGCKVRSLQGHWGQTAKGLE